jgi:hypothetical protein
LVGNLRITASENYLTSIEACPEKNLRMAKNAEEVAHNLIHTGSLGSYSVQSNV